MMHSWLTSVLFNNFVSQICWKWHPYYQHISLSLETQVTIYSLFLPDFSIYYLHMKCKFSLYISTNAIKYHIRTRKKILTFSKIFNCFLSNKVHATWHQSISQVDRHHRHYVFYANQYTFSGPTQGRTPMLYWHVSTFYCLVSLFSLPLFFFVNLLSYYQRSSSYFWDLQFHPYDALILYQEYPNFKKLILDVFSFNSPLLVPMIFRFFKLSEPVRFRFSFIQK